jgi:riboflavin synthase
MFTGIVETTGVVTQIHNGHQGMRMHVDAGGWQYRPSAGDSVSVNGCCLTHVGPHALGWMVFDVVPETLARTTLGRFREGMRVNLEQAATAATLLGGHMVQGHVDAVGEVIRVATEGEWRVTIALEGDEMELVVPKGSITVDGVSLTIASVDAGRGTFDVALIPTTLAKTMLAELTPGMRCNIETDVMARTIVHYIKHFAGRMPAR